MAVSICINCIYLLTYVCPGRLSPSIADTECIIQERECERQQDVSNITNKSNWSSKYDHKHTKYFVFDTWPEATKVTLGIT